MNILFQQHKRRLYTWTSPDGQYQNQSDYILCSQRWRSSIESAKTRPGADCGSDHELLTAKFRLKLKKVGKTTRPFRYDLNQIPHDYTVEMTNRFKGLDRVPEELWMDVHDTVQEAVIKTVSKKKKCKKQNGCLRRPCKQLSVKYTFQFLVSPLKRQVVSVLYPNPIQICLCVSNYFSIDMKTR